MLGRPNTKLYIINKNKISIYFVKKGMQNKQLDN